MSTDTDPLNRGTALMSEYEKSAWETLNKHWHSRSNRRGLPNWVNSPLERANSASNKIASRVKGVVPDSVAEPVLRARDAIANTALRPTLNAVASLLELANN